MVDGDAEEDADCDTEPEEDADRLIEPEEELLAEDD